METSCAPGLYNGLEGTTNSTACLPCAIGQYNARTGADACFQCSKSSNSLLPGAVTCDCIGKNRTFQSDDGACVCNPGYEAYDKDFKITTGDSDLDCQPKVYNRCADNEVRAQDGSCVDKTQCSAVCAPQPGYYVEGLGCQCGEQPSTQIEDFCDQTCQQAQPSTYYENGKIVTVSSSGMKTESTPSLDSGTLDKDTKNVVSMTVDGSNVVGQYPETGGSSTRRRRRRLSTGNASNASSYGDSAVLNGIVCINEKDALMFSLTDGKNNYPVYAKDSMLNSNKQFDYGAFRKLGELSNSNKITVKTFAFTFMTPGVYAFYMSKSPEKLMLVNVVKEGTKCPGDGKTPFLPMTESNIVSLGIKTDSKIILAPNWTLMLGLVGGLFGMIVFVIGGLHYFRRKSWAAGDSDGGPSYRREARSATLRELHEQGSVVKVQERRGATGAGGRGGGGGGDGDEEDPRKLSIFLDQAVHGADGSFALQEDHTGFGRGGVGAAGMGRILDEIKKLRALIIKDSVGENLREGRDLEYSLQDATASMTSTLADQFVDLLRREIERRGAFEQRRLDLFEDARVSLQALSKTLRRGAGQTADAIASELEATKGQTTLSPEQRSVEASQVLTDLDTALKHTLAYTRCCNEESARREKVAVIVEMLLEQGVKYGISDSDFEKIVMQLARLAAVEELYQRDLAKGTALFSGFCRIVPGEVVEWKGALKVFAGGASGDDGDDGRFLRAQQGKSHRSYY